MDTVDTVVTVEISPLMAIAGALPLVVSTAALTATPATVSLPTGIIESDQTWRMR